MQRQKPSERSVSHRRNRRHLNPTGNVLIYVVVLMLIFGVLGVVMVSLFTSSTASTVTRNDSRRARYMAESGMRYASPTKTPPVRRRWLPTWCRRGERSSTLSRSARRYQQNCRTSWCRLTCWSSSTSPCRRMAKSIARRFPARELPSRRHSWQPPPKLSHRRKPCSRTFGNVF